MNIDIEKFIDSIEEKSTLAEALSPYLDCVQLADAINTNSLDTIADMAANMYFEDRLEVLKTSFKMDDLSDIASCILSVLNKEQRNELINLIN